jgi:hypothetical protein
MSATTFKTSRDVISFLSRRCSTDSASSRFLPTDDVGIRITRQVPYVKFVSVFNCSFTVFYETPSVTSNKLGNTCMALSTRHPQFCNKNSWPSSPDRSAWQKKKNSGDLDNLCFSSPNNGAKTEREGKYLYERWSTGGWRLFPNVLLIILIPATHEPCIFYYFALWPPNAQLFHKLSHSYMFRHYCVILRQLVINTLPSYTSMSNAAVDNTIYN